MKPVEIMAKAHWDAKRYTTSREWCGLKQFERTKATNHMQAALTALENAGMKVVPVEPSEAMVAVFNEYHTRQYNPSSHYRAEHTYKAMLAAVTYD